MTTQEKITEIVDKRYHGNALSGLRSLHLFARALSGDEEYLSFLEKCERENPRPIYKIPENIQTQ